MEGSGCDLDPSGISFSADVAIFCEFFLDLNEVLFRKKYELQLRQLKDTEKREKFRVYGELINTYGYGLEPGAKKLEALNYYTNEMVTIPLDDTLTPQENAQKNFEKYNKMKRTFEALSTLTQETKDEIDHLESISTSLDIALSEEDLVEIRRTLPDPGNGVFHGIIIFQHHGDTVEGFCSLVMIERQQNRGKLQRLPAVIDDRRSEISAFYILH